MQPDPQRPTSPPQTVQFVQSAPLGGTAPRSEATVAPSDRRELLLTALLLVLSILAGATSLMSWRDYGRRLGSPIVETGWVRPDGSLGRGWVAVVLAVLVATAGVLIAADRSRFGRTLAVVAGAGLVVLAIGEWGLGERSIRTGPGIGLWVALAVGVLVVLVVGALSPPASGGRRPARSGMSGSR